MIRPAPSPRSVETEAERGHPGGRLWDQSDHSLSAILPRCDGRDDASPGRSGEAEGENHEHSGVDDHQPPQAIGRHRFVGHRPSYRSLPGRGGKLRA